MKIVILCARFPYPLEKGDKLRMYYQIKYLSRNHDIHLISINESYPSDSELNEIKKYTKSIAVHTLDKNKSRRNASFGLLKGLPLQVGYFYDRKIATAIKEEIGSIKPDVIYCQLVRMAQYCKSLPYPKVLDYMDAFATSMQKRQDIVSFPLNMVYWMEAKLIKRYELAIYAFFDAHTIITAQDKESINLPNPIYVLPNGIETEYFKPGANVKQDYDIVFIGNMSYLPNIEAAEYLVNQLLPALKKVNPSIKMLIAGADPHARVKKLQSNNVEITGWVEDIREAYLAAKVFVAPLFSGTGQQNKILEAMSIGIPVITTSQVNQGILASHDEHLLIADDILAYVANYKMLINDEAKYHNIKSKARQFVESQYSWLSASDKLESILMDVAKA